MTENQREPAVPAGDWRLSLEAIYPISAPSIRIDEIAQKTFAVLPQDFSVDGA